MFGYVKQSYVDSLERSIDYLRNEVTGLSHRVEEAIGQMEFSAQYPERKMPELAAQVEKLTLRFNTALVNASDWRAGVSDSLQSLSDRLKDTNNKLELTNLAGQYTARGGLSMVEIIREQDDRIEALEEFAEQLEARLAAVEDFIEAGQDPVPPEEQDGATDAGGDQGSDAGVPRNTGEPTEAEVPTGYGAFGATNGDQGAADAGSEEIGSLDCFTAFFADELGGGPR